MSPTLPVPLRVAAGVVGSTIDYIGRLPGELPSLGVTAVGQAFKLNLRVRQELAALATRGDELLAGLGGSAPEQPEWATFDEDDAASAPGLPDPGPDPDGLDAAGAPGRSDPGQSEHVPGAGRVEPGIGLSMTEESLPVRADPPGPEAAGDSPPLSTPPAGVAGPGPDPAALPGPDQVAAAASGAAQAGLGAGPAGAEVNRGRVSGAPPGRTSKAPRAARRSAAAPTGPRRTTPSAYPAPPPPPEDPLGLRIGALRDHLGRSDETEARALLAREEQGRARAPYLTLLGNRVATLSGANGS